ncbi:MAG: hypothetical protein Q8916_12595, partial [Bacteroidota bacterium]|nr:hypothetical protein [Bacteroidota bacterium]
MKRSIALAIVILLSNVSFAQNSIPQQLSPSVQTDTTSGWQLVYSNPRYGGEHFIGNLQFPSRD